MQALLLGQERGWVVDHSLAPVYEHPASLMNVSSDYSRCTCSTEIAAPSDFLFLALCIKKLNHNNSNNNSSVGSTECFQYCLVTELGRRLSQSTDDSRETAFLFQRLSVAIQRFNSVLIQETFDFSDGQLDL